MRSIVVALFRFRFPTYVRLLPGHRCTGRRKRGYCVPDDVKRTAVAVLAHRLMPAPLDGSYGGEEAASEELVEARRVVATAGAHRSGETYLALLAEA